MAVDRSRFRGVDQRTDRSWPETGQQLAVGDSIEGKYLSKKENVGANAANIYVLETEGGELVGVWGSTVLDAKMESAKVGQAVAIEYVGSKVPKKGGKPYKDFFVGVDPDSGDEDVDNGDVDGEEPPF